MFAPENLLGRGWADGAGVSCRREDKLIANPWKSAAALSAFLPSLLACGGDTRESACAAALKARLGSGYVRLGSFELEEQNTYRGLVVQRWQGGIPIPKRYECHFNDRGEVIGTECPECWKVRGWPQ